MTCWKTFSEGSVVEGGTKSVYKIRLITILIKFKFLWIASLTFILTKNVSDESLLSLSNEAFNILNWILSSCKTKADYVISKLCTHSFEHSHTQWRRPDDVTCLLHVLNITDSGFSCRLDSDSDNCLGHWIRIVLLWIHLMRYLEQSQTLLSRELQEAIQNWGLWRMTSYTSSDLRRHSLEQRRYGQEEKPQFGFKWWAKNRPRKLYARNRFWKWKAFLLLQACSALKMA